MWLAKDRLLPESRVALVPQEIGRWFHWRVHRSIRLLHLRARFGFQAPAGSDIAPIHRHFLRESAASSRDCLNLVLWVDRIAFCQKYPGPNSPQKAFFLHFSLSA